MDHLLCIDDNESFLLGLKMQMSSQCRVFTATSELQAMAHLADRSIDLALVDLHLGGDKTDGINLVKKLKAKYPGLIIVVLSGERDPQLIVEAVKSGASDYLCKPYPIEELKAVIEKNLATQKVLEQSAALIEMYNSSQVTTKQIIGESLAIKQLYDRAAKVRGSGATILIEGESGTGKEVFAKHIHSLEGDSSRPFIAVNCAAIPESLIESELFGHEKGSFTGAEKRKLGKFELANGGDIFLDEINSLAPDLQAKLLRVLQDRCFYRVGGVVQVRSNSRVIVASNTNLEKEVELGRFRSDLLYRLRVISFKMPPLRERISDLPELVKFFVTKHFGARKINFSKEVMSVFSHHDWPGNVRELENLIQSLVIMSTGENIDLNDLPEWLVKKRPDSVLDQFTNICLQTPDGLESSLKNYTRRMEVEFIKKTIESHQGNVALAAKSLKISRSKLYWTLAQVDENKQDILNG